MQIAIGRQLDHSAAAENPPEKLRRAELAAEF